MSDHLPFERAEIESSIVDRWRRVVHTFPEQIALTTVAGRQYTYREIDQVSNRLANALLAELGPTNCPIVLLLDHAPEVLTSILGSLKANKAYVALDPTQPEGQLQRLSDITSAPLIVTDTERYALARSMVSQSIPIWDVEALPIAKETCPKVAIPPDSIAGLFFTSGTVNRPKGIPVAHRTLLHRAWFSTNLNHFAPGHRFSGIRHCGLAGGTTDVFQAMLSGATFCFYSMPTDGLAGLSDWLQTQKITYFHPPIILFRQWLDTLAPDARFPHLRHILPSGRKTRADLERLWPHVAEDCVVLTSYSSTETALITCTPINRWTPLDEGVLHVGRPVPDKCVVIIKDDGNPATVGEEGEIVVRSRYLAASYWRQPDLSRQRFEIASDGSGEIPYHTGDVGRMRCDGCLDIVGRRDSQVKVRGYRVVLSEIEDALQGLPTIKEAVVTADEEHGRLFAYLVSASEPAAPPSAIRLALSARLPSYLVPTHMTYLASFPLLPSGKVNRRALPPPDPNRPELDTAYVAPRTAVEQDLAAIWGQLLDLQQVGIYDNFLELGGHSLLIARLLFDIQQHFDVKVDLTQFVSHPTIATLAHLMEPCTNAEGIMAPPGISDRPCGELFPHDGTLSPTARKTLQALYEAVAQPEALRAWKEAIQAKQQQRRRPKEVAIQALPYEVAAKSCWWLVRQAQAQKTLFAPEVGQIRQFLNVIDSRTETQTVIERSLFVGFMQRYGMDKKGAARQPSPRAGCPRVQVEGMHRLEAAKRDGQGVLLVRSHDGSKYWFRTLHVTDYHIGNLLTVFAAHHINHVQSERILYARQLEMAHQILRQGGTVDIVADGILGTGGELEYPFHGRRRRFRTGFAELALLSDALVIPVVCTMCPGEDVVIRFLAPLDAGDRAMPHADRVEQLVSQYMAVLHTEWANRTWMIPWYQMERHLAHPALEA